MPDLRGGGRVTLVVYSGTCPDCNTPVGPAGVQIYNHPPVLRVIACRCGSRAIPKPVTDRGGTAQ